MRLLKVVITWLFHRQVAPLLSDYCTDCPFSFNWGALVEELVAADPGKWRFQPGSDLWPFPYFEWAELTLLGCVYRLAEMTHDDQGFEGCKVFRDGVRLTRLDGDPRLSALYSNLMRHYCRLAA